MQRAQFDGVILSGHKEDAIQVPFDPTERWAVAAQPLRAGRRGHAVNGTVNGCRFRSFIVSRSRKFWLLLPAELEVIAGVTAGDKVTIKVGPDHSFKPKPLRGQF